MAKGKKFDYRVVQNDALWTAEIIRQVTSRDTVVSKSKAGFTSEADAKEWGEGELKSFVQNLNERNKRRDKLRELKQAAAPQPVADTDTASDAAADAE